MNKEQSCRPKRWKQVSNSSICIATNQMCIQSSGRPQSERGRRHSLPCQNWIFEIVKLYRLLAGTAPGGNVPPKFSLVSLRNCR